MQVNQRILNRISTLLLAVVLCATTVAAVPREKGRIVKVVDGDTLVVSIGESNERVRLIGIDTPEKEVNEKAERDSARSNKDVASIVAQGARSFEFVRGLLPKGTPVSLEADVEPKDKYGRRLAYVFLDDGRMLNEVIVSEGYASPYTRPPNVRYAEKLAAAASVARAGKKGLWSEGDLTMAKGQAEGRKKKKNN